MYCNFVESGGVLVEKQSRVMRVDMDWCSSWGANFSGFAFLLGLLGRDEGANETV